MTDGAEEGSLKQVFTLQTLVIYGVGDILGAGIYAVIGKVAGISGYFVWAAFILAMVVAAFTALSYAELGSRFPKSGGVAYFVQKAFNTDWLSVMVGWLMFCTCLVSMATLSNAFAGYLNNFAPILPRWLIILVFFAGLTFVNFRGIEESSWLNMICTFTEVAGLFIVMFVASAFLLGGGTPAGTGEVPVDAIASPLVPIFQGAALAFYSFIGFEDIVNVAEEVKNPQRTIPKAILLALGIAGIIYIAIALLSTRVLTPAELTASSAPLLDVVRRAQPNFPLIVFTLIPLFAVLNTALLNFVTSSRLLYGMSREGLLPAWLGKVHPERGTPYRTILIILPIVIVLALSGTLAVLAGATATLILLMFALVNLSLLMIKRREPATSGFKVPFLLPALALVSNLVLIAFASAESLRLALGFIAIGVVLVLIHRSVMKKVGPA